MNNRKTVIINNRRNPLGDLERILAATGHESVVVNDALSAVSIVIQQKPGLILMELKMPHKTGFELADEINRAFETERIPIIGMSELFRDEFGFLLEFCGINGYLQKPFKPLDVIWAVENIMEEDEPFDRNECSDRVETENFQIV